jgi:hypothetical protein
MTSISDAAFALFTAHRAGETKLTRKAGNFLGECVVDPAPLTEKQAAWLKTLAERAGLPALDLDEVQ